MYRGGNGNSIVSRDSSELVFNHIGLISSQYQAVYIQFYEHEKNPNRVVYFDETLPDFDVESADKWLESELSSNSDSEIVNQVLTVYPNTYASIQFEVVYTTKLDPNSAWNYIGIFPKYIQTSELSITHTNIMKYDTVISTDAGAPETYIGEIKVSPASFTVKTITENKDVTLISALGVFAGIVSFLLAIQVILFGARPVDPWGLFQKTSIRANRKDKKKKELERHFGIPDVKSVPFITPVHKRFTPIYNLSSEEDRNEKSDGSQEELLHERIFRNMEPDLNGEALEMNSLVSGFNDLRTRLSQLEGRNQILELVLKSYYIDDKIFRELYPDTNTEEEPSIEKGPSIEERLTIEENSTIQEKRS
ncbi:hypothetical protein BD770DRAFT_379257 [Pilaira anomala]|nr:hypothetical protein BD770DRAFT_379257 [Pilaira anomala]